MFRCSTLTSAIFLASVLLAGGCGNSTGGGGGPTFVGAPAGSTCNPQFHNEGCLAGTPMKIVSCVDANGTAAWKDKSSCGAKQYCVEEKDPADAGGVKKLAVCKDVPVATTGVDATTGDSDGGGTADAGPKKTKAEEYACVKLKCPTEVAACDAAPTCAQVLACATACADDEACSSKCAGAILQDKALFVLFLAIDSCGKKQKCIVEEPVGPTCGDGKCESGETAASCPGDCEKVDVKKCGNGTCDAGETATTCAADCKAAGPKCGNEKCESGESYATCPTDCQCKNNAECGAGKVCGDGICTAAAAATCGDFVCAAGESKDNCPLDCDPAVKTSIQCVEKSCGKDWAKCKASKSCVAALICMTKCTDQNCLTGCAQKAPNDFSTLIAVGTCAQSNCQNANPPPPKCGDGKCDAGENSSTCSADCKGPATCKENTDCAATEVCANTKCIPGTGGMLCKGRCGKYDKLSACQCDSECKKASPVDCCTDYDALCVKAP